METVRTRMAPSPTGNLHLGTAYATLWTYLFAKHNQGTFILRIEDTDQERSTKAFEENIILGLQWLGLPWDEGPFHQMERLDIYKGAVQKLVDEDKAYFCFCTKEELDKQREHQIKNHLPQVYSGKCRNLKAEEVQTNLKQNNPYIVRFKLPENRGVIKFNDLIHGEVVIDSKLLGDMVIMRQNGIPLYNFAVVVDDIEMKITHVLRGDDHLSNTPKQILFFEALGAVVPEFSHYPMILNQDRLGKLSKRTGSTSLDEYKKEGYLPEAILNYLALLGWSPKNDKEIFSKDEMIKLFDIKDMNKAPAAWNLPKLDWINGEYIRSLSNEELTQRLEEYLVDHPAIDKVSKVVPLIKARIKKLSEFVLLTNFIFMEPEYDIDVFEELKIPTLKEALTAILDNLKQLPRPWDSKIFEQTFRKLAQDYNISASQMFQLIRVAVSGQLVTPPLFECIELMGEDKVINRIDNLLQKIESF